MHATDSTTLLVAVTGLAGTELKRHIYMHQLHHWGCTCILNFLIISQCDRLHACYLLLVVFVGMLCVHHACVCTREIVCKYNYYN